MDSSPPGTRIRKALAEVENDRLVDRHFRRGDLAGYMKRQRETPLSFREVSARRFRSS
jgi:hypothetical protein